MQIFIRIQVCHISFDTIFPTHSGLFKGLFSLGFSCKTVFTRASAFLHTSSAHFSLFLLIAFTVSNLLYKSNNSILCLFHHSSVSGSRQSSYILLNIFLSKILNLDSSVFLITQHVLHTIQSILLSQCVVVF